MPGFIIIPIEGESFHSFIARYCNVLNYQYGNKVVAKLLGRINIPTKLDLPSNINYFISTVGDIFPLTVDDIIEKHSLWPFYRPFIDELRKEKISQRMRNGGGSIYASSGINASKMKKNKVNKYCPVCYQEDINNYGFAIWHLDHQIPEILVCTIHHCFLLSCPETLKSLSRSSFIDINSFQHIDLTFKKCESMLTLKIASEMIAILKGVSTFNVSKAEYQSRLKHFYSSNSESLDSKNFTNELKLFYSGDEILSKYLSNNNWPVQLIKRPGHFFHPIRHLIINQFVNSITKVIVNPKKPFGNGPWVCINKACKQYGLYSIPAYTMHSETKSGREIYSFECECGMIYSKSCLGNGTAILDVPKIKIWGSCMG
jgi:hypothetical protein